jgi:multicomponent Na+:H+ antiporter subunit F
MNAWMLAAAVLLFGMAPCGWLALRGDSLTRLAGLEMAGLIATLELVLLAQAFKNPNFYDLALCLALLAFGSGLVFVRFLERWL